jgi:hypothetical protein
MNNRLNPPVSAFRNAAAAMAIVRADIGLRNIQPRALMQRRDEIQEVHRIKIQLVAQLRLPVQAGDIHFR